MAIALAEADKYEVLEKIGTCFRHHLQKDVVETVVLTIAV